MEARRKLIVVSNRGPVSYRRGDGGERIEQRGQGGLVTALRPLVAHHDVTWVASAMTDDDRAVAAEARGSALVVTGRTGETYRLRLVTHDHQTFDRFYNRFANPTLWFLQHDLWGLLEDRGDELARAWEDGYVPVNRAFAEAVLEELAERPDATVFFHDYHLYLAPRFVREQAPDALLAHFVHIPWPQTDYWHVLPDRIRREIHAGVLANDVVGFHTRQWGLNFMRAATDLAGAEADFADGVVMRDGRTSLVTVHPISVDPSEFDELASSDAVLEAERELIARRPEKLVLRVDRTDPSKNIVRGFRAFELYLDAHPEMHRRVGMLAMLDPSRQEIPEYAEYLGAIQREARRVNDRFQQEGWIPIDLMIQDNFVSSVAAYKQFDALFVNAIFDGMNLVAKEAPLVNEHDGVLILSENAGAHAELGEWALSVNPFDVAGQAEAIHRALTMPTGERRERLESIRAHVREHDVAEWIAAQLEDLDRCRASV